MISPELRESFLHRYGGGARSAQLAKGYYRFAESLGSNATAYGPHHERRLHVGLQVGARGAASRPASGEAAPGPRLP
jgi:hypothetical protein